MKSSTQVRRCFLKQQCTGTSFVTKRSFISLIQIAQERHLSCSHRFEDVKTATFMQRKNFSDGPTQAQPTVTNERESLVHGTPSAEIKQLSDDILNLNTLDMSLLVEIIQRKLGISESVISGMLSGGGGGRGKGGGGDRGDAAAAVVAEVVEPEKEKDAFDIKLTVVDPKSKIKIIKEVRALTGLGLKEAKDLVEKAPVIIKAGVKKEEVDAIKKILTDAGAQIEIL